MSPVSEQDRGRYVLHSLCIEPAIRHRYFEQDCNSSNCLCNCPVHVPTHADSKRCFETEVLGCPPLLGLHGEHVAVALTSCLIG